MATTIGVRFREVGKIYDFDPGDLEVNIGDHVIVDTARGTEYGTVIIGRRQIEDSKVVQPLKVVRRLATPDDDERVRVNREKEKNAFDICREKIRARGLDMKLISAEYTFDNSKILFYFAAEGRVDFRELVKDLASVFRIRIELRQIGVRDETKMMGGLGCCGRPLCCSSYLSDFVPVSIRMAKEQNLSLNPQKISGMCGRLMCCLKYEADAYEYLNAKLPKQGDRVIAPGGREGIAETVNVLLQKVRVMFVDQDGDREMEEYPVSELKFTPRKKKKPGAAAAPEKEKGREKDKDKEKNREKDRRAVEEELIEEETAENDPALAELAAKELDDIEAEEDAQEEEGGESATPKKKRRRRRRRKHARPADPSGSEDSSDPSGPADSSGPAAPDGEAG